MSKVALNYWPSLILSLVLLAGIVACLRRLDYLVVEEVRALISILFGFATSCLLLSFIWLIQRKPLNRRWPNQHITIGSDVPNMNPTGRTHSIDSIDERLIISTISNSELDIPPAYEEALINSKPVYRQSGANILVGGHSVVNCKCFTRLPSNDHTDVILTKEDCSCVHLNEANMAKIESKLIRKAQSSIESTRDYILTNDERKGSCIQLDVNQLPTLSSSPPKYFELSFNSQRNDKSTLDLA